MSQRGLICGGLSGGIGFFVDIAVVLGILADGIYAALYPPMLTRTTLVILPRSAQSAAAASIGGQPDPKFRAFAGVPAWTPGLYGIGVASNRRNGLHCAAIQ
jgi:hypothetical protein